MNLLIHEHSILLLFRLFSNLLTFLLALICSFQCTDFTLIFKQIISMYFVFVLGGTGV
jgi:hypothetical protein